MNGKIIGAIVIVLAVLGGVVLFSSSDDEANTDTAATSNSNTEEIAQENTAVEEAVTVTDGSSIALDMSNFEFSVSEITAKAGETVSIDLTVSGGRHDFVIDELDVQSNVLGGGEAQTLEFTIPEDTEPGEYSFYCSIGNHRSLGMEGTLTVQ